MQPLKLTLKGFRGIRDRLGLPELTLDLEWPANGTELITIAGANGSVKSTIMDSLVPFIGLPSRAGNAGTGGFSYYDHVYLPEIVKNLTWSHEGRCYRSQIVIRMNGSRRNTEAFLHGLDDDGSWRPVRIEDGTVSDGRVESYTRCVEHICGSAETFFTSVFAVQGKRQLNTYRNAEIKTLLADLLGQEEIRCIGQKASEVARMLKAGLGAIRQEQAGMAEELARVEAARQRLEGMESRIAHAEGAKQAAQFALDTALELHARLSAEREQSRAIEARRSQLIAERQSEAEMTAQSICALQAQDLAESQRLDRLEQRVATRQRQEQVRRQTLAQSQRRRLDVLGEADAVGRACPSPRAGAARARPAPGAHTDEPRAGSTADAMPRCRAPCRTEAGRHRARGRQGGLADRRACPPLRPHRRGALRRHRFARALQVARRCARRPSPYARRAGPRGALRPGEGTGSAGLGQCAPAMRGARGRAAVAGLGPNVAKLRHARGPAGWAATSANSSCRRRRN